MIVTSTLVPPLWPSRMSLDIVYCPLGRWGEVNKPLTNFCSILVGFYVLLSTLCAMKFLIVYLSNQFSSIQLLSHVRLFVTAWTTARQASLSITNTQSLLKPMPIELVMLSNHLILCRPLLLLAPIPASIRVFSNQSTLHMRWPKCWSFSFSISPSNEHPGLTSFRRDWLDLLAVQGTLKSLLQHHSSKASIFWHSAFFTVQLSHPYMTHWKNHSLDQMDLCWQSNVSGF